MTFCDGEAERDEPEDECRSRFEDCAKEPNPKVV